MRRALIPIRVIEQVELMILLRIVPLPRLHDLRHDRLRPTKRVCLLVIGHMRSLHLALDFLCYPCLLGRVREDRRAVLRTRVGPLLIQNTRVVRAEEELCRRRRSAPRTPRRSRRGEKLTDKLLVAHNARIELDPKRLRVPGVGAAHLAVRGVVDLPAGVPDGGLEDALVLGGRVVLQENVLDAPEAACCERRDLWCS